MPALYLSYHHEVGVEVLLSKVPADQAIPYEWPFPYQDNPYAIPNNEALLPK